MRSRWYRGRATPLTCLAIAGWLVVAGPAEPECLCSAEPGVVVEEATTGETAAEPRLEAGDVILGWRRAANPPTNPEPVQGCFESPFDVEAVEIEHAPRGEVSLTVSRGGSAFELKMPPGEWRIETRPRMSAQTLDAFAHAMGLSRGQRVEEASSILETAALTADDARLRVWLLAEAARLLSRPDTWNRAQEVWARAIEASKGLRPSTRARVYHEAAAAGFKQNDHEGAIALWREAMALFPEDDATSLALADVLKSIGTASWRVGDLDSAEECYLRARAIVQEHAPGSLALAGILNNMGLVARERGQVESAETLLRASLEIKEELAPGSETFATTLLNLGLVASERGDLSAAEEHLTSALALLVRLDSESFNVAMCLNNLAMVAQARGDLDSAEDYYRRALAIKEQLAPGSLSAAGTLNNLGNLTEGRGDLTGAEVFYLRALEIKERLAPGSLSLANTLHNLGDLIAEFRDSSRGWQYLQRALQIKRDLAPGSRSLANTLAALVDRARCSGDLELAEEYAQEALTISHEVTPTTLADARTLNILGSLARARGDLEGAERLLQEAHAIAEALAPASDDQSEIAFRLAQVELLRGDEEEAEIMLRCAINALEKHLDRLGGSRELRAPFRARRAIRYQQLVELLVDRDRPNEAFHVLERFRAQELLASLIGRGLQIPVGIPEHLEMERRLAVQSHDEILARLSRESTSDADTVRALRHQLAEARQKIEEIRERIMESSPRLAATVSQRPLDLAAAGRALETGTVMLSYMVDTDRCVLFVVAPAGARSSAHSIPIGAERLDDEVARHVAFVADPWSGATADELLMRSRQLSALLLQSASTAIASADHLVIVPDGPLHQLPFAAISDPNVPDRFLVEEHAVSVVASATVLGAIRARKRHHRDHQVVAFGAPRVPDVVPEMAEPELASSLRGDRDLSQLPASRIELEHLSNLFPARITPHNGAWQTPPRPSSCADSIPISRGAHPRTRRCAGLKWS